MDNETVIEVRNVSKAYRLWRDPSARIKAPLLARSAGLLPVDSRLARSLNARSQAYYRDFYALSDISFEVRRGESVGIIGRNGSGKSTLLQLIAGTMETTAGSIVTRGTIGALLELGSGFKPEFTGKENVYIHGAILGLSRAEIDARYEEIVDFADIGDFIDRPLRTYSSGMAVRLAFAVRATMEPDILIVDEALSVGDMFFQAKCMRAMRQLKDNGCTILYVSHAMNTVKEFCERAVLLHDGRLIADSVPAEAVQKYLSVAASANSAKNTAIELVSNAQSEPEVKHPNIVACSRTDGRAYGDPKIVRAIESKVDFYTGKQEFEKLAALDRIQNGRASLLNVQMIGSTGTLQTIFEYGDPVICRMLIRVENASRNLCISYHVRTKTGIDIIHGDSRLVDAVGHEFKPHSVYTVDWGFELNLTHGDYYLNAALTIPDPPDATQPEWEFLDIVNFAYAFSVTPRKQGMIGATTVWNNGLLIKRIGDDSALKQEATDRT